MKCDQNGKAKKLKRGTMMNNKKTMFCPKCGSEYKPEYTMCGDCGVQLVSELSPSTEPVLENIEFEDILSTNNPGDVAIIKSLLDGEGITYIIQGEHVAPLIYYAVPIRLLVRKEHVEKAVDMLKDLNLSFTFGGLNNTEDNQDEI